MMEEVEVFGLNLFSIAAADTANCQAGARRSDAADRASAV